MSAISGTIIEDAEELAAIAPEWWDLWRRIPEALPFLSPAWLVPWWRHFAPGRLFTLVARKDGRLVGLAPGYIEEGAFGRRILPLGISLSDHLDVLADPACEAGAMQALLAVALTRRDEWDAWELENLPPAAAALRLTLPAGVTDHVKEQSACPVLTIPEGMIDLVEVVSKRKRGDIYLARNRSARRGAVRIERIDACRAGPALDQLFQLHSARWRSREQGGVLDTPEVQAFQRDATPALLDAGLLRIYTLSLEDQVVAVYHGFTHAGVHSVYLSGFDPAFRFESPGALLMAHAFQEAISEGCREIDFLRGQEPYKYRWGAADRWNLKRSIRHDAPHG